MPFRFKSKTKSFSVFIRFNFGSASESYEINEKGCIDRDLSRSSFPDCAEEAGMSLSPSPAAARTFRWLQRWRTPLTTARRRPFCSTADGGEVVPGLMAGSASFRKLLTPELEELAAVFRKHGFEVRMAGGAVRDLLTPGGAPKDVDLATEATPDQMKAMLAAEGVRTVNDRGEAHGTVTARVADKVNFEITTLRVDGRTRDGRRPETVRFVQDWRMDAARRDLTVNSMFLGLDGTLYDYFGGRRDLARRRVVFVGDPEERIREDYLRILRYYRFFGSIRADYGDDGGSGHDADTVEAIRLNVAGMGGISGERIWSEWKRILSLRSGCRLTCDMVGVGLAPFIGLPSGPDLDQMMRLSVRGFRIFRTT